MVVILKLLFVHLACHGVSFAGNAGILVNLIERVVLLALLNSPQHALNLSKVLGLRYFLVVLRFGRCRYPTLGSHCKLSDRMLFEDSPQIL